VTKKLIASYLMKDGSRFTDIQGWQTMDFQQEVKDRDTRLAASIRTPGYKRMGESSTTSPDFKVTFSGYHPDKYVTTVDQDTNNASDIDLVLFRTGEILLNYVEAVAEAGTITQADLDLTVNQLRKRGGISKALTLSEANASPDPFLTDASWGGYQSPVLLSDPNKGVILEIRRERAIELFQEGLGRYFDLMRWKAGYCLNQPFYGMYINGPGTYNFGDDSKYTFYVGSSSATGTRYQIHDPEVANETSIDEMFYLVDPNTGNDAIKGVRDILRAIPHSFDESKHYFYPLNEKDLQLNENLKQNPNW
jgi:hypothetical protein